MKPIKKEIDGNTVTIYVEYSHWIFWKKVIQYKSFNRHELSGKYLKWAEMPNMINVSDLMSFQLDRWNQCLSEDMIKGD